MPPHRAISASARNNCKKRVSPVSLSRRGQVCTPISPQSESRRNIPAAFSLFVT